jgi:hypothetical protein
MRIFRLKSFLSLLIVIISSSVIKEAEATTPTPSPTSTPTYTSAPNFSHAHISIIGPHNGGGYYSNVSVFVESWGIDTVTSGKLFIDNSLVQNFLAPYSNYNLDTTLFTNGLHSLRVEIFGTFLGAPAYAADFTYININNLQPTLTPTPTNQPISHYAYLNVNGHFNQGAYDGIISVYTLLSGQIGFQRGRLFIDDDLISTYNNENDIFPLDTRNYSNGAHSVRVEITGIYLQSGIPIVTADIRLIQIHNAEPTYTPTETSTPTPRVIEQEATEVPTAVPPTITPENHRPGLDPTTVPTSSAKPEATKIVEDRSEKLVTILTLNRKTKEPLAKVNVTFILSSGKKHLKTNSQGIARMPVPKGSEIVITVLKKGYSNGITKLLKITTDLLIPMKIREQAKDTPKDTAPLN